MQRANVELELRLASVADASAVLYAHRATSPGTPSFLHRYEEGLPFGRYLAVLARQRHGSDLLEGQVPTTFLFAFVGGRVVGRVSIRHQLTPALERLAGHIGYVVVPEHRRRGYATEMLRQALLIASRTLELPRVLLTCDEDNVGSRRAIEKNGGVLQNAVSAPNARRKRRYWIELPT